MAQSMGNQARVCVACKLVMKILVTGCAGLLGRLCNYLVKNNYFVYGIDNLKLL